MTRRFHRIVLISALAVMLLLPGCATPVGDGMPLPGLAFDRKLDRKLQGYTRSYRLYLPDQYDPARAWPVVIAIHGAFSTAAYHEQKTGFSRVADEEGFVVLYPNGIGILGWLQHWNAGHCCGKARDEDVDDVAFVFAALEDAQSLLNIDRRRVYVTGFSNGGMLTHRIGAERGNEVAAIAAVAGAIGGSTRADDDVWQVTTSSRALPVLLIHGDRDQRVPYVRGPGPDKPDDQQYLGIADATAYWSDRNRCRSGPLRGMAYGGRVIADRWGDCSSGSALELLTITDWGHTWPGPDDPANQGQPDLNGFDAALTIWRFFEQRELPEPPLAAN